METGNAMGDWQGTYPGGSRIERGRCPSHGPCGVYGGSVELQLLELGHPEKNAQGLTCTEMPQSRLERLIMWGNAIDKAWWSAPKF